MGKRGERGLRSDRGDPQFEGLRVEKEGVSG
jgi:hypothetical protein